MRVAGIVTHRQRPGTASGVIFMSIEDETGVANLIVWPRTQEELRHEIIGSTLVVVSGKLQAADGVINVVMEKARDYSRWLGGMTLESRDFR